MRIIALILAILIFNQSLSVCGPKFTSINGSPISAVCTSTLDNNTPTKSCCSSLHKKDTEDTHKKKHKDCCGDNCKCLSCAKVYMHTLKYYTFEEVDNTIFSSSNNMPILYHSFDFHPSLTYPPRA